MSEYRSSLKRARGLGSAKDGSERWLLERFTAVALVPLTLWFMVVMATQLYAVDYIKVVAWLKQPLNAILLGFFLFCSLLHGTMGLQVVIEDYVHKPIYNLVLLTLIKLLGYCAIGVALFAIISIYVKA